MGAFCGPDGCVYGVPFFDKQLLRTGPDNLQRLQDHARELRRALLEP